MPRIKTLPDLITKNCPICKKNFDISFYLRNKRTYCSKSCANHDPKIIKKMIGSQNKTFSENYGMHPMKTDNTKNNLKLSIQNKYGVDWISKSSGWYDKVKKNNIKKYGIEIYNNREQSKITCLQKYGVNNALKIPCIVEIIKNKNKLNYFNRVKSVLEFNKIKPLFDVYNISNRHWTEKYNFKCLNCNYIFEHALHKIPNSIYCEKCNPDRKKTLENELFEFLSSLQPSLLITRHDRTILHGKELDFYFPKKKLAIEFNGLYWHSEVGNSISKKYHLNKTNGCLFHGIQLIHIMENEWRDNKEIIKSKLKQILDIPNDIIIKNNTTVKPVDINEKNKFLNINHLNGEDKSNINYGLYCNDKLISIMTFIKSRINKKNEWEISRYCDAINITTKENNSKILFDYFIKDINPSFVLGYNDKRFSNYNTYIDIGFKFTKTIPPDYYYISPDYKCIYNKENFRKSKLSTKLPIFDPLLSEWENMKNNKWDRIWDCGHIKWIWTIH